MTLSPNATSAVMIFYFALFCVLGFSIVPLALRFFISAQIKIGNGELFLVKWLQAHEQGFVFGVWIMFIIGLCISLPAAIKEDLGIEEFDANIQELENLLCETLMLKY